MAAKQLDINDVFEQYKPLIDKAMEQHLPRNFDSEGIANLCGPARYAYDLKTATHSLLDPLWDILDRGTVPFLPLQISLPFPRLHWQFN